MNNQQRNYYIYGVVSRNFEIFSHSYSKPVHRFGVILGEDIKYHEITDKEIVTKSAAQIIREIEASE